MNYLPKDAYHIAAVAHDGYTRNNGVPYIMHLERVASRFEPDSIGWQAAMLHDILEDTNVTEAGLFNYGVPFEVVEIVKIVTKQKNESYREFIHRILASGNETAVWLKLADIQDNVSDNPSFYQLQKYGKALIAIGKHLEELKKI